MKSTIPSISTRILLLTGLSLVSLSSASAQLASQYGILDLTANGGINPNTGVAWQAGDQYRLAFYTAGTIPGTSNDPAFYDGFATSQANLSTLGNGAITTSTGWTALVWVNTDPNQAQGAALSDPTVRAGLNDFTGGAGIGGAGVPVYVMDGTTAIARNNADIDNSWSNPFDGDATLRLASGSVNNNSDGDPVTAAQNVFYSPFLNQYGLGDTATVHGTDVMTGGIFDAHINAAGDTIDNTTYSRGASNANNTGRVWNRFTDATTALRSVYAVSELLTVQTAPAEGFELRITPNASTVGNYDFEWESKDGMLYDLVSATNLSTAPETWAVWEGQSNLAATAPTNTLSNIPGGGDSRRFFAVIEKSPPPLLSEDFEAVTAPGPPTDWSFENNAAGTAWSVGTPAGVGTEPDAAANGSQCAGTNIGGNYTSSAVASIITKAFTVPAGGATLSFSQYIDTELATSGDLGSIRLLNASDNSVLAGGEVATGLEGITEVWSSESIALPAVANGLSVKLEFRFESDEDSSVFSGFYIDDVVVTQN